MVQLQQAWEQLLQTFEVNQEQVQATYGALVAAYNSPGRFYHTLEHIRSVLVCLEELREQAVDYPTLQLAAWFHDSIYDPRASDNEEQSALYMQRLLTGLELPVHVLQDASSMILCTKTHLVEDNRDDSSLLQDADLAILGATVQEYETYALAIRQEYAWVPEPAYRSGRVQVLRTFLQRERIYWTASLYTHLEARARENLRREVASFSV